MASLLNRNGKENMVLRLPNSQYARIQPEKLTNYLLSPEHSDGRSKAKFFLGFGFTPDHWQGFADALLAHGANNEVVEIEETQYGIVYCVNGVIETPDGRNPYIRTVWQVDHGTDYPKFITAYPA